MNGFAKFAGLVLTIGLATEFAAAQAAEPAVDTSSPKAAMKSFYIATERGDALAMSELQIIEGDPNQELAKAYADLIVSAKHLADVVRQKYPGAANDLARGAISPEDVAKIDSGQVVMKGDNAATIKIVGRTDTNLRRTSGGWRVVTAEGVDAKVGSDKRKALLASLVQATNKAADDINADKFPTIQDAETAVRERLSAVYAKALQGDVPTTRPATRP